MMCSRSQPFRAGLSPQYSRNLTTCRPIFVSRNNCSEKAIRIAAIRFQAYEQRVSRAFSNRVPALALPPIGLANTELFPMSTIRILKRGLKQNRKVAKEKVESNTAQISDLYKAPLSLSIQSEYDRLVKAVLGFNLSERTAKKFQGTGGTVSLADIIAYQIGWGKLVINWYQAGIAGKMPDMPGDGFSTWNYTGLALHFYKKYQFDSGDAQMKEFHQVVKQILAIVEKEYVRGNLDREGVWDWCTLKSGKRWPLSKWVIVNTASPYKKAAKLIKSLNP